MERNQSRELMCEAIGAVFNACIETGDQLEPNGVVEALMTYYVSVYRSAGWGDDNDMIDDAAGWVEHLLDNDGEEDDGTEETGSDGLPRKDDP